MNLDTTASEAPTRPEGDNRARERTEHVYSVGSKVSFVNALSELWLFREVVWSFASRTLRLKYKQTLLGIAWIVIQPLLLVAVFIVVFGRAADISGGGTTYGAFALTSLVGWGFLSSALSIGANSLVADAALLRKVYFPREAPVVGTIGASVPDLFVGMSLIVLCIPFTGASLGWSVVLAPILVAALVIPALAVTLPLAALSVYYRDFRYVVPFGVQLWLFASPVVYPVTSVPERWRPLYAVVNPAVGPLEGLRRVFAVGVPPDWSLLGLSTAAGTVLLVSGYWFFKRLEREFADVV